MPMIRYQIRNEYGLANPELYQSAEKEDPEALLEGVAMAGLVGVLRQLGDLAEFAAQVFHDLHEEVIATAARGHGLKLRVEQLEAEFPSIEKAFLSQNSHPDFAYNSGVEWRANLRMDENLVTQGEMPRFIMDSYEECRGPPRLFMLDKFDGAGAGACLKRYSDPSLFRIYSASSDTDVAEIQRDKKTRKIKKKGPRPRNGETLESLLAPDASNSESASSDQVPQKNPTRCVKLKMRQLKDLNIGNMEHIMEIYPPQQKVFLENSGRHSDRKMKFDNSNKMASEAHKVASGTSANSSLLREGHSSNSISGQSTWMTRNEMDRQNMDVEIKTGGKVGSGEAERSPAANLVDRKVLADLECKAESSADGFLSDGISSELDNYMDALNIMESEVETDSETKAKSDPGFFNMEFRRVGSGINEVQKELGSKIPEPKSVANSAASHRDLSHFPVSNALLSFAAEDTKVYPTKIHDEKSYAIPGDFGVMDSRQSIHMLPNGTPTEPASDDANLLPTMGQTPHSSSVSESTSITTSGSPQGINGETKSVIAVLSEVSSHDDKCTAEVDQRLDGNLSGVGISEPCSPLANDYLGFSRLVEEPEMFGYDLLGETDASVSLPGIRNALETDHAMESTEEAISDDVTGAYCKPDHISATQDSSSIEKVTAVSLNDSLCYLTLHVGEIEETNQDNLAACLGGSTSPTIFALSPDCGSVVSQPICLAPEMKNFLTPEVENMVASEDLISMVPDCSSIASHPDCLAPEVVNMGTSEDLICLAPDCGSIVSHPDCLDPEMENVVASKDLIYSTSAVDLESTESSVPDEHKNAPVVPLELEHFSDEVLREFDYMESLESLALSFEKVSFPDKLLPQSVDHESKMKDDILPSVEDLNLSNGSTEFCMHMDALQHEGFELTDELVSEVNSDNDPYFYDSPEASTSHVLSEHNGHPESVQEQSVLEFEKAPKSDKTTPMDLGSLPQMSCSSEEEDSEVSAPAMSKFELLTPEPVQEQGVLGLEKTSGLNNTAPLDSTSLPLCSSEEEDSEVSAPAMSKLEILNPESVQEQRVLELEETSELNEEDSEGPFPAVPKFELLIPEPVQELGVLEIEKTSGLSNTRPLDSGSLPQMSCSSEEEDSEVSAPAVSKFEVLNPESVQEQRVLELEETSGLNNTTALDCGSLPQMSCSSKEEDSEVFAPGMSKFEPLNPESVQEQRVLELEETSGLNNTTPLDCGSLPQMSCSSEEEDLEVSAPTMSKFELLNPDSSVSDLASLNDVIHATPSENGSTIVPQSSKEEGNMSSAGKEDAVSMPCSVSSREDMNSSTLLPADSTISCGKISERNSLTVICSQKVSEHLEPSDDQLDISLRAVEQFSPSDFLDFVGEISEPDEGLKSCVTVCNNRISKVHVSPSRSECGQPEEYVFVNSESGSELLEDSLNSKLLATEEPFVPNFGIVSQIGSHQSSVSRASEPASIPPVQEDVEETAPPPPLPPLEWRMGKLQLGSLISDGKLGQHPTGSTPFVELSTVENNHNHDVIATRKDVQPTSSSASLQTSDDEILQHCSSSSKGQVIQRLRLSDLPPIVEENLDQVGTINLLQNMMHPCEPSIAVSSMDENHLNTLNPVRGGALQQANPFAHPESLLNDTSLLSTNMPGEKVQSSRFTRLLQPSENEVSQLDHLQKRSEFEKSQDIAFNVERGILQPSNPFFEASAPNNGRHQYVYGVYTADDVQLMNLSMPQPFIEPMMHRPDFMYLHEGNPYFPSDTVLASEAYERPKEKFRSILNRPRDPLIEAVASHDKSTLRRVSDLVQPSTKPKADERNSLLEQIRNKSFNLKPAVTTKPNMKGPLTNIRVAAILEKANAIRQAFVGSDDDDDDGESWSDS